MTAMQKAIVDTVGTWRALLRYFPNDEISGKVIMRLLAGMVGTPEELAWLRDAMVNQVGEWQGAKELRGVFCSRFRPADGVETDSTHAEFSPIAGEARQIDSEANRQLALCSESKGLIEAADVKRIQ